MAIRIIVRYDRTRHIIKLNIAAVADHKDIIAGCKQLLSDNLG